MKHTKLKQDKMFYTDFPPVAVCLWCVIALITIMFCDDDDNDDDDNQDYGNK